MTSITITRQRINFLDMTNRRFPWKYIYSVYLPDGSPVVEGTDRLSIARRRAREAVRGIGGNVQIIESWKAVQA